MPGWHDQSNSARITGDLVTNMRPKPEHKRRSGNSIRTVVGLIVLVLALPLLAARSEPQAANQQEASDGPPFKAQGQLVFTKPDGATITMITIQIADNNAQRAEGLMWRKFMRENDGMLFIFDDQEILTFWMKNTYIPLDMVFAEKNGTIVRVYAEATPFSEAPISSEEPAQYVVEVNGGFCAKYGIKVGDRIAFEK